MYNFLAFANDPEILEGIDTYFKEKAETPKEHADKLIALKNVIEKINKTYESAQEEIYKTINSLARYYLSKIEQIKNLPKISSFSVSLENIDFIPGISDDIKQKAKKDLEKSIGFLEFINPYFSNNVFKNKINKKLSLILLRANILNDERSDISIKDNIKFISNKMLHELNKYIEYINIKKADCINEILHKDYNLDINNYLLSSLNNNIYTSLNNITNYLYQFTKIKPYTNLLLLTPKFLESIKYNDEKESSKLIKQFYELKEKLPDDYCIRSYSFNLNNPNEIEEAIDTIIDIIKTTNILKQFNIYDKIKNEDAYLGFETFKKYFKLNNFNTNQFKEFLKIQGIKQIIFRIERFNDLDKKAIAPDSNKETLLFFLKRSNYDSNTTKLLLRQCNNILFITNIINLMQFGNLKIIDMLFRLLKNKDANFIVKIISTIDSNKFKPTTNKELKLDIIEKSLTNFGFNSNEQVYKIIQDVQDISDFIHINFNISEDQESNYIEFFILNKIDPNQDIIKKIFLIVNKPLYKSIIKDNTFFSLCAKLKINGENLIKNYNELAELFSTNKITSIKHVSPELKEKVNKLSTNLEMLLNYDTISQYVNQAQPKDKALFKLNYQINNNLYFKVLEDLSYNYFTIGTDTDCCQRIGGAGEEAAIDSFINPLAGVLVLYHNSEVVSQSYFHYVPQDNGIILDNVEINEKNVKKYNINLDEIYAALAQKAKQDMNLKYFRCGLDYNNLDSKQFSKKRLPEDPREFSVSNPYSDFDEDRNLDLLAPKFKVNPDLLESFKSLQTHALETLHTILKLGNLKHLHRFL